MGIEKSKTDVDKTVVINDKTEDSNEILVEINHPVTPEKAEIENNVKVISKTVDSTSKPKISESSENILPEQIENEKTTQESVNDTTKSETVNSSEEPTEKSETSSTPTQESKSPTPESKSETNMDPTPTPATVSGYWGPTQSKENNTLIYNGAVSNETNTDDADSIDYNTMTTTQQSPTVKPTTINSSLESKESNPSELEANNSINPTPDHGGSKNKVLTIVFVIICASLLALVTFGYGYYRYRNKDKGSYSIPSYTTGLM